MTRSRLRTSSSNTSRRAASNTSSACAATPTSPCWRRCRRARRSSSSTRGTSRSRRTPPTATRARRRRPSVVLSHLGPGLTNAATGVANAALDSIPMVVIAGDVPTHYYGKHPHQEVNLHADASQYEIYRPFVKRAWRVDRRDLFPEIIEKAFPLAESGRPGPVLVDVPMDIFSRRSTSRCSSGSAHNTQDAAQAVDSTTRRRPRIVAQLLAAKTPVLYVGGGVLLADAADELREFAEHLAHPGRAHADGQGRAARRSSADARHDRLLGHEVHQRQVPGADWILGARHALLRGRLQLVGAGIHVHLSADEADPHRHRPGRDRPQLPDRDRCGRRPQAGAQGAEPRRAQAGAEGRAATELLRRDRGEPRGVRRRQPQGDGERRVSRCGPSGSSPTCARRCRATRSSRTDVGWNKNGVGQQFPIYDAGQRSSRRAATRRWASARRRRSAPRSRARTASSSRWSATAASARTRRCSRPRSRRTSRWSG